MAPRGWMVFALATLGSAAVFTAQAPRPAPRGALAPGGTGLIAGRVIDPGSGSPVPGVVVWLQTDEVMREANPRVMADSDGRFVFINVPAGRYRIQTLKSGHVRGFFGQKLPQGDSRDLDLTDGQILTDVSVPIWKHAAIGGTVTDEAGEPVVGVSVRAFRKIVTFGEIRFTPSFQGTIGMTDDRGIYRISSLIPGEYIVAVPSTSTTFPAEVMSSLMGGSEINSEALGAISEISTLGNRTNQQIGDHVLLTRNAAPIPPTPSADELPAVYRTTFYPTAAKLGDATVSALKAGEERSGADISLKPVQAVNVSGRLVAPDGPIGPTAIRLLPIGETRVSASPGFETATGLSDAAGRFTLLGVPEGQYVLWVETRPSARGQPTGPQPFWWASEAITVGAAAVSDVTVNLRRPPRLTARTDVRGGRTLQSGAMELLIEPIGFGTFATQFPDSSRTINVHLSPGRYVITPFTSGDVICTAVILQDRDVSDEPLVMDRDDVEVTIVCGDAPTRLSGLVRSDRGAPDPETLVVVFPTDRRYWPGAGVRPRRIASARPSTSGSFAFSNFPPGEYFVAAVPIETSEFWQEPTTLDTLARVAARVTIAQGESRTIDVRTVRIR